MSEDMSADFGIVTAYGYALSKGYTGTEEEFAEQLSRASERSAQIDENTSVIADLAAGRTSKMLPFTELYYREYETGDEISSNGSKSTGLIYCHANPWYTYRYTYHGYLTSRGCAVAFFDADKNYLKPISIVGVGNGGYRDLSDVVPEAAFYVEFSSYMGGEANPTACLAFERQSKLKGKKIMLFGDSITARQDCYVDRLLARTGMVLVHNFAVSGSAWVHSTRPIKNQVQELLNAQIPYEAPDIVFISAGTNDDNDPSQSLEIEQYFTQVIDNAVSYIPYQNLPNDNISRAMRWCISTIQNLYPNAMVFVTTPIQAAAGLRPPSKLKTVADIIKLTANRMSVRVIDAFGESGIYGEYENASAAGKYLRDGLHPKSGTTILGDFYAQELNTQYCRND